MKVLFVAAALFAAFPAAAQAPNGRSFAALVADGMRPELPKRLDGGLVMTEVSAEGGLLVVRVEDRENIAATMAPEEMAREMAEGIALGFCADREAAEQMLKIGLSIRADLLLTDGRRVESPVLDRCPD